MAVGAMTSSVPDIHNGIESKTTLTLPGSA
jgi:hypothetical protein